MNTSNLILIASVAVLTLFILVAAFRRGSDSQSSELEGAPDPMEDGVFGHCESDGIGAFNCSRIIATPHSKTTNLASHIWLYGDVPTDLQKAAFRRLVNNYDQLWPNVANELSTLHPDLATAEEVALHLRDRVAVHIGEYEEDSVELVYEFGLPDEGIRGFFLRVEGIQVIEAVIAE